MKRRSVLLTACLASSLIGVSTVFADFESTKKNLHIAAYNCVDEKSQAYANGTCERAPDIVPAVGASCKNLINEWTQFSINNPQLQSLSLNQRLDIRDKMTAAILSNVSKIVMDTRMAVNKMCN